MLRSSQGALSATELGRFEPADRAAWRNWLDRNHRTSSGVWLVFRKGPQRQLTYADAVEEALCFGWIDSVLNPIDKGRYMQLFTPRKTKSGWSRLNKRRAARLIAAGLMTAAGLEKIAAAKRDGSWRALDAVESLKVPKDFQAALEGNPEARRNFDAFTPSARKRYLYWINNAKRAETRARRLTEAVALIAQNVSVPHPPKSLRSTAIAARRG
jgi:uncharacterized protein YdeI (YjbR/CyaY-like superfamily)